MLLAPSGCGADDPDQLPHIAQSDGAIVNGQTDSGHPAVVALVAQSGSLCSGTLITPTVVLTAAHCLPPNIGGSYTGIDVFFGTNIGNGQFINVVDGWTNPAWNDQEVYEDIGLVRLQVPAPVAPIPMNTTNLSQGQATTLVGFGITSANNNNSGTKRIGTATIAQLDPWIIVMSANPSGTCSGDSGGSTLINIGGTEYLAGVHSRADCMGESIDMRVDGYLDDIQAFTGSGDCSADGLCAANCSAPDPDCPCAGDGFCTSACGDGSLDPDCDPNCIPNGICADNCAQLDSDCDCSQNGQCNPLCESDADCVPAECAADGQCNDSCVQDVDCWQAPGVDDQSYTGTSFGSCRASTGTAISARGDQASVWLLALGLLAARRRRRDASGRAADR